MRSGGYNPPLPAAEIDLAGGAPLIYFCRTWSTGKKLRPVSAARFALGKASSPRAKHFAFALTPFPSGSRFAGGEKKFNAAQKALLAPFAGSSFDAPLRAFGPALFNSFIKTHVAAWINSFFNLLPPKKFGPDPFFTTKRFPMWPHGSC